MAQFELAYPTIQKHEGGYANNHSDRGGETYAGISRRNWPGWEGWKLIDIAKGKPNFPANLKTVPELPGMVAGFYQHCFWLPNRYGELDSQPIATWMLDRSVNCGDRTANKMLQRALGIPDDGIIGPQTIVHSNAADPTELREKLHAEAETYYRNIVAHDPSQGQFLDGWLARA